MDLTQSVVEQLMDRARTLTRIAAALRQGEDLSAAVALARDPTVWSGAPQRVFCGWLEALDAWVRNQLAGGVAEVGERIEVYARSLDDAQRRAAAGLPGACPAPPRPISHVLGRPPQFSMQLPAGPLAVAMAPDAMKNLANCLGRAKDALLATGRRVDAALLPPTIPAMATPVPVAAQLPPADHLPPDAREVVGWPAAWLALAQELDRALQDVLDRADKWIRAGRADRTRDDRIPSMIAAFSTSFAGRLGPPRPIPIDPLPPPLGPPLPRPAPPQPSPPPPRSPRDLGAQARRFAEKGPGLSKAERQRLREVLHEANRHAGDPQWCASFIASLGEEGVRKLIATGAVARKSYERRQILGRLATVFNAAATSPACDERLVNGVLSGATWRLDLFVAHGRWNPELAARAAVPLVTAELGAGDLWRDPQRSLRAGLRLLQQNPETAQAFIRAYPNRMANLLGLGGDSGERAAAVFELATGRSSKAAEDALEAVLLQVARGKTPGPPGALAIARQLGSRMPLVAMQAVKGPSEKLPPAAEGFNVEPAELRKCFAAVLADKAARAEIVKGAAVYAAEQFKAGAAQVAAAVAAGNGSPQDAFIESATRVERLNDLLGDAMKDLKKRRKEDGKVLVEIVGGAAQLVGIVFPVEGVAAKITVAAVELAAKKGAEYAAEAKVADVSAYGDYYSLRDLVAASLYEQEAIRNALNVAPPPNVRIDTDGHPHLVIPPPGAEGRKRYLDWLVSNGVANQRFSQLVENSVAKLGAKPSG